jgi:hypothetical protein
MSENIFIDGLITKKPNPKAPTFVKVDLAIKVDEFYEFAKRHSKKGWLNLQIKESKSGTYYTVLNSYETPADKVYEKTKEYIEQEVLADSTTSESANGEVIDVNEIPF